jgi:RarD protein
LASVRRNLILLLVSGAFVGFNWILLFESYRYTTVSTATLCYYMATILVVIVSPFFLRERLTLRKLVCVVVALGGMLGVSGGLDGGMPGPEEGRGILCGLGAAVFYAGVMLLNKQLRDIDAYDRAIVQLAAAALVLLPYSLLTEGADALRGMNGGTVLLLLLLGVVHTGLAYFLYFGAMGQLPAQTVAILSYLDPTVAILLSTLVLQESISLFGMIGAALVLIAALVSELPAKKKK